MVVVDSAHSPLVSDLAQKISPQYHKGDQYGHPCHCWKNNRSRLKNLIYVNVTEPVYFMVLEQTKRQNISHMFQHIYFLFNNL